MQTSTPRRPERDQAPQREQGGAGLQGAEQAREQTREQEPTRYRRVCTIAGSDSGGGAGIQADIKAISALGCYAASVITALTAQNTVAVRAIHTPPVEFTAAQIDAVFEDIGADAVKIGMLASAEITAVVAERLRFHHARSVVLDPVMVAKSGDRLLSQDAEQTIVSELLPLADVITPNVPEAEVLSGLSVGADEASQRAVCEQLLGCGPRAVLLKGGHLSGETSVDLLALREADGSVRYRSYEMPRVQTANSHGTGCSLSSAIAALLARGLGLEDAIGGAKEYLTQALQAGASYRLGTGHGPIHHFYAWWR